MGHANQSSSFSPPRREFDVFEEITVLSCKFFLSIKAVGISVVPHTRIAKENLYPSVAVQFVYMY